MQVAKALPTGWAIDASRSFNRYHHAATDTRANSIPDMLRVVQHWLEVDCEYKVHSRNLTSPIANVHTTCRGTRRLPVRRKLKMPETLTPFDELTAEETDELFRALFSDPVTTTTSGDAPSEGLGLPPLMPELPAPEVREPAALPAALPAELKRLDEFATTVGPRGLGVFSKPKSRGRTRARPRAQVVYSDSDSSEEAPAKKPKRVSFSDVVDYIPVTAVPEPAVKQEPPSPPSPATIMEQIRATTAQLAALQAALTASAS